METTPTVKIIDEIRGITADQVAKKQDAAKMNFPKIIDKIKAQASLGSAECILSLSEMNEYDKALLVAEGFSVSLVDVVPNKYDAIRQFNPDRPTKEWKIKW